MAKYEIGSLVFSDWIIREELGAGSFGKVFRIQRQDAFTQENSALKVITVPQNESELRELLKSGQTPEQAQRYLYSVVENIVSEITIMSKLKATANVVSYEDYKIVPHEDGMGWDILIRMELLHPLLDYAYEHPFSRRDIIRLGTDMCKALSLCQKYNVIHRDIKPENIFVSDNGDYKLGDFGIAKTLEKSNGGLTKIGSSNYMAPEVFRGERYGFSVDIYSLGIVLYRLLNRNRTPFLPEFPKEISLAEENNALTKRMCGDPIPMPYYSEGRLPEIVLKACAFSPADRYSSPLQMQTELEAILYEESDAAQIYPDGDTLEILRNYYVSTERMREEKTAQTVAVFPSGSSKYSTLDTEDKTERLFGAHQTVPNLLTGDPELTEPVFGAGQRQQLPQKQNKPSAAPQRTERKKRILTVILAAVVLLGGTAGVFVVRDRRQKTEALQAAQKAEQARLLEEHYQTLMTEGIALLESDAEQAKHNFLEAQAIHPDDSSPYVSYAYACYLSGDYAKCISYVEDELGLGKQFSVDVQSRLSEILGAAYFEQEEYAAAASFFRLSTAGGDITVSSMRDYAVSLGRLGDYDAADRILTQMIEQGANEDTTFYVQAEVQYAQEMYTDAEWGFRTVLERTDDAVLQRRCLRSLAEVYRDCAVLARTDSSPIYAPATKEVEILAWGIETFGLRYDATLWEMLGLAYFESYHTDTAAPQNYLKKSAECFQRVIELGVQKDYLYSNLYTVYYEMQDYVAADEALSAFESQFPKSYLPHAFRSMMLITIENAKMQSERDYSNAVEEYEKADDLARSGDDLTYLQQLSSLIEQLRSGGWIE